MQRYIGYTLVDITATGITRSRGDNELERNQQRNWETVMQCIGLRTQPLDIKTPVLLDYDFEFDFGEMYTAPYSVWMWSWSVERDGIYDLPGQAMGGLVKDFEQVPVITGLAESARFILPIFYPYGAIKNIYFERIHSS
jgi:hypothetical protein